MPSKLDLPTLAKLYYDLTIALIRYEHGGGDAFQRFNEDGDLGGLSGNLMKLDRVLGEARERFIAAYNRMVSACGDATRIELRRLREDILTHLRTGDNLDRLQDPEVRRKHLNAMNGAWSQVQELLQWTASEQLGGRGKRGRRPGMKVDDDVGLAASKLIKAGNVQRDKAAGKRIHWKALCEDTGISMLKANVLRQRVVAELKRSKNPS